MIVYFISRQLRLVLCRAMNTFKWGLEMNELRKRAIAGVKAGDVFDIWRTFKAAEISEFTAMSGDNNPVHLSQAFARMKGFDGCIHHGLHTASLVTEVGGELGLLAAKMNFQFKKPVYSGDKIHCRVEIIDLDERGRANLTAILRNQHGDIVLEGDVSAIIPTQAEWGLVICEDSA